VLYDDFLGHKQGGFRGGLDGFCFKLRRGWELIASNQSRNVYHSIFVIFSYEIALLI